jgi:hypothetical protein
MKKIFRIIILRLLTISFGCQAQIVETTRDIPKLKENQQQFINKPLKNLLKEIKPQIKTVWATKDEINYFSFRFRTSEQINKNEGNYDDKVSLYVYVKENIDWDFEKRPKENELNWSQEDIEKYGNLTVIRIKVYNPPKE